MSIPPATAGLIAFCIGMFIQQSFAPSLTVDLALWPLDGQWLLLPDARFAPWQVLTYAFLHAGFFHLAFNMFGLWMFGSPIERHFGARRFLLYFVTCAIAAALTQLIVLNVTNTFIPTLGASGGVFGLLLAYAVLFPRERILLLVPPVPVPARVFAGVYAGIELLLGLGGPGTVAHFAHLGGMLGGVLLLWQWKVRPAA